MNLAPYKKFLVAAGAFLGVVGTVLADGDVSQAEAGSLVVALLGAVGVFFAKNAPKA